MLPDILIIIIIFCYNDTHIHIESDGHTDSPGDSHSNIASRRTESDTHYD